MGFFVNEYGLESLKDKFANFGGHRTPCISKTGFIRRFASDMAWNNFQSRVPYDKSNIYHPTYYNFYKTNIAKKIFTVYDFTHEKYSEMFRNDHTAQSKKEAFAAADGLICISNSTKKDLLELYDLDSSCDVAVIHLGYNDLSDKTDPKAVLPDAPYLLFVGNRSHYKNFTCLVDAYAASSDLKKDFALACLGPSFSAEENELFKRYGILDKIHHYAGGDGLLGTLYKHARAFVYPSLYEGFGLPPLEAMNCGCPVVAGNSSSIPEVTGDAALLFDPASSESLMDALRGVAYDDDRRSAMITAGKERCKLFSWDRCASETYEFYQKIISE
jgi:glycosyltransferase involved in cell wall biosynthesis